VVGNGRTVTLGVSSAPDRDVEPQFGAGRVVGRPRRGRSSRRAYERFGRHLAFGAFEDAIDEPVLIPPPPVDGIHVE
jgi:hypothetical protein